MALELRDRLTPHFQRLRIEHLSGLDNEQLQSLAYELLPLGHSFRSTPDTTNGLLLSELVEVYLKDRSKNIDDRTALNMRHTFDLFMWVRPLIVPIYMTTDTCIGNGTP